MPEWLQAPIKMISIKQRHTERTSFHWLAPQTPAMARAGNWKLEPGLCGLQEPTHWGAPYCLPGVHEQEAGVSGAGVGS